MMKNFDYIDGLLLGAVFLGSSVMAGIGSFDLFNVAFTDVAFDIGEGVTVAAAIVLAAYIGTILTNDNTELSSAIDDVQDLEGYYYASVIVSLGLVVAWVFIPDVSSFIQSSDLWGVLFITGSVITQVALGWML
jgi:hypothetical protein